jgi:myosin heavy subunit
MPPSVFAIAEGAYSHMMRNNVSTSVIISGESGAGKTETARQILAYIARVTTGHKTSTAGATHTLHVKDRLVTSTLVTEAFGNAMTTRNDNSSRFGKLMSIAFRGDGSAANGFVQVCTAAVRPRWQNGWEELIVHNYCRSSCWRNTGWCFKPPVSVVSTHFIIF